MLGLSGATAEFVEFGRDAPRQFDGVTLGNRVLVSTQTGKLFGVTVAHEVGHVAENTGNEAWAGFEQVVLEEAKIDLRTDDGLLAYARRYAPQIFNDKTIGKLTATRALDKLLPELGSNYNREFLRKEFAKDVFGNAVMSDGFMGRVARKLARTDMPLLKNIVSALTKAINVLRSKGGKFATGDMIKNLERVRDEAAKVMAEQVRVQSKTNAELKLMVKTNPAIAEAAQGELDMRYSPAKNAAVAVGKSAKDAARKDARLGTAISASFKPGDNYGTVGYPAKGGNLTRLHERMLEVTRSAEFDRMLASIGLRPFGEQTTIRGMWLGKPEWTQLLRLKQLNGEPATFEQTRAVANLLAWAAQQDAAITSRVVETPEDGEYNIPSLYFGKSNGEAMSADEIDNALQAFSAVASGASATADGKAIKFLFFPNSKSKVSEADQYDAFIVDLKAVAAKVGLDPNPARAYTISALDEFNKRTNENEGRGYRGRLEEAWGKAAKGLGPRAVQGGIGGRAVDTVLVPYIAALRAEGFAFDFDIWQQRNGASEREVTELRAKVEAYEAQKKHGLVPKLRETIDISGLPNVPIEAKIGLKTTSGNADRYLAVLDGLKTKFPDAVESAENWLEMEAHAFGSNDVPVAPRNLINLMQDDGAGILTQIRRLTPGQIKDANSGFDNAAEFLKYYTSGQVPIETTGKLMLWSFLSRGVSPYIQEAMFVDAVRGVEPFIKMAAAGQFGPAQLEQFIEWSDSVAQANGAGAPGNATKHNLNAFGKSFLTGMSERLPNGKTKLQHLHDLMADKRQSGRDIRREFVKMGEGVGIDNKVISFTLLVTGRPDVLVLDRIQMRNLFDDGSFAGYNLYDGTRVTKLVTDAKNDNRQIHDTLKQGDSEDDASFDERVEIATAALAKKLGIGLSKIKAERTIEPGTGLASATTGVRGLMLYEFFEDKLQKILPGVYQKLGRPQDATPGRYHLESWVVVSGQEASHGTLDSLLYEVEGKANPFADVTVKQGEYGQKDYGVRYGRDTSGNPYYLYPASTGELYRLNHQAWRDTLKGIDKIKGKIPGFLLSKDADGRPRVAPWYEDSRIDRTKIDDLLEKNGTKETDASYSPARAGSADDAQQGGKPAAGLPPQFGQARRGAVQVRGVHYSQQVRSNLSGAYYGTGMKGEEGARLADPRNADIRSRIYFYVDEGKGVTPESNVGPQAHDVDLNNLYDVKADPVGYRKAAAGDASKMERLIKQGGFDGYYAPGIFGSQGVAILIGDHSVPVRSLGMGYRGGEAQAPVQSKPTQETDVDRVDKARTLPAGQMTGADWKRMIPAVVPGADVSMLEDGRTYYKSDVVGAMRGAEVRYNPKRVTVNGVERPTENSDGKPIHYTEDGIINFWKWYDSKRQNSSAADRGPGENLGGVWSALDKQGRPRVFYHGTGDDVSAFDLDHENRLDQGWLGTGVYLASDRELANGYADIKKGPFKFGNDLNPGKPNVMPLYVALHNPLIVDDRQKQSLRKKARPRIDQWTAEAKAAGYDGVVMRFGDGSEEVVVFDPSAVKSATGNNGQFDSANPDIRYSPARWYFSPLEKAFESAPDKVFGKAQQVKLWLAANKSKLGLKDDEILWTGINDFLDLWSSRALSAKENTPALENFVDVTAAQSKLLSDLFAGVPGSVKSKPLVKIPSDLSGSYAMLIDRVAVDPENLGNFRRFVAGGSKGFGLLNIHGKRLVVNAVRSAIHDLKVRQSIVELIPVDVMNNLVGKKTPTDVLLHDVSVLENALAIDNDKPIPSRVDVAVSSLVSRPAFHVAEIVREFINLGGGLTANSPAKATSKFHGNAPEDRNNKIIPNKVKSGAITKADVMAYLAGSGVQVEEVMKGRDGYDENNPQLPKDSGLDVVRFENLGTEWQDELESQSKLADYVVTDNFGEPIGLGKDEADAISDAYMGHPEYWEGGESTKYGQYVLPGGTNYKELLLTLPVSTKALPPGYRVEPRDTSSVHYRFVVLDQDGRGVAYGITAGEAIRKATGQENTEYKSAHWDERNVLAHIRMNDRTDADGNKVLFVEELQSDWGQEGKKKGFNAPVVAATEAEKARFKELDRLHFAEMSPAERIEYDQLLIKVEGPDARKIPAAPFVTDTKAWVSLAVKRIMAYAAANGYAKVAFVNGEQSADRYDLSKKISRLEWKTTPGEERGVLLGWDTNGDGVLEKELQPSEVEDYTGKEIADRLINAPVNHETVRGRQVRRLEGMDLKVGGEGMKAFYDRIVPQVVSDVLKKVGGGKMEMVRIDTADRYEAMKSARTGMTDNQWNNLSSAEQAKLIGDTSTEQPGFTVPASAAEPMPLFSPARATQPLPAETKAQAAQRVGQDKFNRFGTLKEWAEANGLKLSEQADVYRAEERYHGRVATRLEDFREKTLKPLIKKIHKAGFTMQDVAAFLEAQHTPEANAHIRKLTNDPKATAAGVTDAEAATYLAQANPALARVANEFRQITEQSKRLLLKSGLISQEQADAWSGAYQHYVPLKGGPEEQAARTGQGPGMSVNAKQKRRLGHGKRAEFVIENIIRDHERAIMLSEKNLVGQHLLQAAIELQQLDPDLITIGKPEKRKVYVPGKTTYAIDYNGSTVAAFDSENEARRFLTFMGKSGMTIRQVTGDPHIQMTAAPMLQENEAGVYVQGQLVRVQINDEILARAYKNLGVENLNAVLRGARHLNTWLSKAYTGLNPEFILVNMARDFTGGLINITGNYGGGIATTAIANYPKAMMEILAYSMRGKTSANVQQYRENGGSTGGAYLSSLERVGQDIAAQYNEMVGVQENLANRKAWAASRAAGRKTFKFFTKWIEHMNAASENAMRLAVFMAVRDKTGSLAEAASAAKNSTVNFDRVGEAGRMAGALYLFANPNIQGTAGLWKSLIRGKHNGQAWALVGGLIALAVLAAMQFDDDEWKKIPEFEKDRNLLIRFGENRIKIPVPYGYGFFFGLGNVYRNIQAGDSVGKVSAHLASALFEHFSPFGNPVQSWTTMLPTAIKIPVQHAANVNDFNRQIVPENQFNKNKPDFLKMNRSTKGTAFDTISRGLNEMSGGTAGTSGAIDISPETTKTLWRTMTGGTGAFWTDLFSYGRLVYEDADRDLHEVPVVRKFAAEPRITDVRANYFEEVDKAKKVLDQFNAARKEHDQVGMDKLKAEKEMLALARAADASRAAIKAMRDKQDKILNDTEKPLAYRRAEVKQLERKEAELYQRILKAYGH